MVIKKSFIPLLTLYSITAIILSTAFNFTVLFISGLISVTVIYIYSKDNSVAKIVKVLLLSFFVIAFTVFFFYSHLLYMNIENDYSDENRKEVQLTGYVTDIVKHEENKFKVILKCNNGFNYFVTMKDDGIRIGDIIELSGVLYKPEAAGNKGQFDYQKYCYSKNISADIYLNRGNISKIGNKPLIGFIGNIREKSVERVMKHLSEDKRGIVTALIAGSRIYLDKNTTSTLQKSGLSHILSISGTHFNILIIPFYYLLTLLSKNNRFSMIFTILAVLFLLVFTGLRISAIRAALCIVTLFFSNMLYFDSNRYLPICLSSLIIILINPLSVYDYGFIMSYSCVVSIALFSRKIRSFFVLQIDKLKKTLQEKVLKKHIVLEDYYRRMRKTKLKSVILKVLSAVSLLLSVQPLTVFITYRLFHCIYPYSLFSNLIIFILITPLLLSLWSGILFPRIMCPVFGLLANHLVKFAEYIGNLPYSKLYVKHIPDIFFIIIICTYLFIKYKPVRSRINKYIVISVATLLCVITLCINNTPKVIFMDVGQGDCAVITLSNGYNIMIDTGEYIDLSAVAYHTGHEIDLIILTHSDSDHCGAIEDVLDNFSVDNVYLPYTNHKDNIKLSDQLSMNYPDTYYGMLKRGDEIKSEKFYIKVLNPDADIDYTNANDGSVVFNLYTKAGSFLFTGDADIKKIPCDIFLKCDIIKMPHHGDEKAINSEIIDYISPKIAVISVGKHNRYGHPGRKTLDILAEKGINTLRTDINGSVTVYLLNRKYYLFKYR